MLDSAHRLKYPEKNVLWNFLFSLQLLKESNYFYGYVTRYIKSHSRHFSHHLYHGSCTSVLKTYTAVPPKHEKLLADYLALKTRKPSISLYCLSECGHGYKHVTLWWPLKLSSSILLPHLSLQGHHKVIYCFVYLERTTHRELTSI
jgi:hypothetical protein